MGKYQGLAYEQKQLLLVTKKNQLDVQKQENYATLKALFAILMAIMGAAIAIVNVFIGCSCNAKPNSCGRCVFNIFNIIFITISLLYDIFTQILSSRTPRNEDNCDKNCQLRPKKRPKSYNNKEETSVEDLLLNNENIDDDLVKYDERLDHAKTLSRIQKKVYIIMIVLIPILEALLTFLAIKI